MIKILIVDDQIIIRKQFVSAVNDLGLNEKIQLLEAGDGNEGQVMFERVPDIRVLLVDINMPNKDGVTMLTELKEKFPKEFSEKIVFMVTAQSDEDLKAKVKTLGVSGWVLKPIDAKKFISLVMAKYFPQA